MRIYGVTHTPESTRSMIIGAPVINADPNRILFADNDGLLRVDDDLRFNQDNNVFRVGSNNSIRVDINNIRIGVNTNAPLTTLDLVANGSDTALRVRGTTSNNQAIHYNITSSNNDLNAIGINYTPTMAG